MRRYKNIFSNGRNRLSSRVLLLVVTSSLSLTLIACSPSNTSASDLETAPPQEAVVATQTAQEAEITAQTAQEAEITTQAVQEAEVAPIMTPITTQSTLLKNVSATVYKNPNCGCCKNWVSYVEGYGVSATTQPTKDLLLFKDRYGVPEQVRACHTAVTTDGYVFEGHVPAKYMAQFLENPPVQAIGLAVPGMPIGSPGMETGMPVGSLGMENKDMFTPYQVMQFNKDGTTEVYAAIDSVQQQL